MAGQRPAAVPVLLLTERLAIGALIHSRICLMGAYQNPVQRAEIGILTVILALLNGTLNALVCMGIHSLLPPSLGDGVRLPAKSENIHFHLC